MTSVDLSTQWETFQDRMKVFADYRLKPIESKYKEEVPKLVLRSELKELFEEKASIYDFGETKRELARISGALHPLLTNPYLLKKLIQLLGNAGEEEQKLENLKKQFEEFRDNTFI